MVSGEDFYLRWEMLFIMLIQWRKKNNIGIFGEEGKFA